MYNWIFNFLVNLGYSESTAKDIAISAGIAVVCLIGLVICRIHEKHL